MTVDVIIPTLRKPHAFICLSQLRYMPWPINLHLIPEGRTWPEAVNIGFDEVKAGPGNDVVLMDDDVFIEPTTFSLLKAYYDEADLFGFKLRHADGSIQHAGSMWHKGQVVHRGWGEADQGQYDKPIYCCHVTTSLIYIKNSALEILGGMARDYEGMQYEDVDFNFRALKAGLKIMYLPGPATHLESASKKFLAGFGDGMTKNKLELYRRHVDNDPAFLAIIKKFPYSVPELSLA